MPRSLAERFDHRSSLSRASVGKGSLGRFSVGTEVSMSSAATAATRHWVNSVSDIYGPDEIEELLADLNKLELAQFDTSVTDGLDSLDTRPERIQRGAVTTETFDNFDIDGSVHQGPGEERGLLGGHEAGPASPLLRPSSPGGMSWNSHTHYQQFKEPPDDYGWGGSRGPGHIVRPLRAAVCYCDMSVLATPRTLLRVLVLITSVACLSSLVTSGTAKLGVSALPHFAKLRLLLFVSLASALFSALVIFLNISHLHALIPMDYSKMQTLIYLLLTLGYLSASSLAAWVLVTYSSIGEAAFPGYTKHHLVTSTVLGYLCSLQTLLASYQSARHSHYAKMEESSTNFTLHADTVTTRAVTADSIHPPAGPGHAPGPRPLPPPAPRPQPRHAPLHHAPPPSQHTNYSELVKASHKSHNQQHNHNGGRQLPASSRSRGHQPPAPRSPPQRTDLPPVRSVSQHRLGTAEELAEYYELRPRIPDLTQDDRHLQLQQQQQQRVHSNRVRHPAEAQTSHAPLARPESNTEPSYKAANNKHLVQNSSSKKVHRPDDKEEGDEEEEVSVVVVDDDDNLIGDNLVNNIDSEETKLATSHRTIIQSSSNSKVRGGVKPRTRIPESRSDAFIHKPSENHRDNSGEKEKEGEVLLNSNTNTSEIHPILLRNSFNPVPNNAKPFRETGAIPKKKKSAPLPSPLTLHPDEIISLPMDDLSPSMSASNIQKQRFNNFAH